ncbi:hypothetical protein P152DRAFT_462085 [Eremomyces bilateralis CBS 781.70]|uniref:Uncharacterized protein n=1 Tax=Eremomyces bilateralis CBS 781.70 TaxID=1392243 RepID=A0A6G1FSU2_9PEZI|nr:uncharacterized protein P152DRAFT_462085 [Eremomyces bilateralis CBS 781.70]KAF1808857.1 hypothetical protein P152DRAFT_462085 [Eremomyces bilateralis CBS 781.70]
MLSLLPHAEYAEDQKHAKSILTFHVLRSGFTAGAFISLATSAASTLYWRPSPSTTQSLLSTFGRRSLVHAARGSVAGLVLSAVMLGGRMRGREPIEWQDRAWRVQESVGQSEADKWIIGGEIVGIAAAVALARTGRLPALQGKMSTTILGGAGLGAAGGTTDYMVWRYGIRGEKRTVAAAEAKS